MTHRPASLTTGIGTGRPFIRQGQWTIPAACNPIVQQGATLRVSVLAGLITVGLLAGPGIRGGAIVDNLEKAVGPSILVSAPEIVPAASLVGKRQDRIASIADVTFSAPQRDKEVEARPGASSFSLAAKITPLDQAEIVDAATIRAGAMTIRLSGIEPPKAGETCRRLDGLTVSCQDRALSYLQLLVKGKTITCAKAGSTGEGMDEGRCRFGETDIAEQLVRQGWAKAGPQPEERMVSAELAARRQNLGIWRKEIQSN